MGILPVEVYKLGGRINVDKIDWPAVWEFVWPILKEGLIALLIAVLTLLGYDKYVPSRYVRGEIKRKRGGS